MSLLDAVGLVLLISYTICFRLVPTVVVRLKSFLSLSLD